MQKVERQSKAAMRNSSYAVQSARENIIRVIDEVMPGTPTAPVEITHQTSLYKNTSGAWRARLDVDFPDVTLTVDQKPVTVSGYELYGYEVDLYAEAEPVWEQYGGSDTSSITRMDLPPGVEYMMKVRAIGGVWSSEFRVFTSADTVPPPQPTKPTAEVFLGAITVRWDGKAVTGDMPADFEGAILCVGEEPSPGLDKAVTRFDMHEKIFVITGASYYKPVFIRLIAVDTSGNLSPWSEQETAMTKPLVDADIILGEIDAAETVIKNAHKLIIESGVELGQKLQESDRALAETEKRLTGPGGLTERLSGAERLLEDVGALTYDANQTLREKLTSADASLSNTQAQLDTVRSTTLPKLVQDLGAAEGRINAADIEINRAFAQLSQAEAASLATNELIAQAIASGQSLVLNGSFEAGMTGWQENAGGVVLPEAARSGTGGMRITPATGNAWPLNRDVAASTGRTYYAEMWVRRSGTDTWSTQVIGFCAQPKLADGSWGAAVVFRPAPVDGKELTAGDIPTDRFVKISAEVTLTQDNVNLVSFAPWFYQSADNIYDVDDMLVIDVTEAKKVQAGLTAAEASIKAVAERVAPLEANLNDLTKTVIPGLQTSIDGKTAIIRKTAAPTSADVEPAGTRWEVWSNLSGTGKLRETWRRTGSNTWAKDVLDPVYLPQVDIGEGTFGSLSGGRLEANTVTANQIDAASIAAAVGTFVKINVENITATATATLNTVVAQRIAAGTASFQTVDAKNIFVTGTASLNEVVAKRFAADTGQFLTLGVEQLDVTGTANLKTAVADRFFANIFASNKLTTNELLVGKGENLIPWLVNAPVGSRTTAPHVTLNGAGALNIDSGTTGLIGAHATVVNTNVTPGIFVATVQLRPANKAPNLPIGAFEVLPNTKYKLSVWVKAGGTYGTYPDIRTNVGIYNAEGTYTNGPWNGEAKRITWEWQEIVQEFTTNATASGALIQIQMNQPGTMRIDQPSLTKDAASLIATGGIVASHITASEEMSAKIGSFLKLDVGSLTATGTSTLDTAVITNLWTNVVRSRSITTDMLLVGKGTNLIPNGDLANGKEGWNNGYGIYNGDPAAVSLGYPASIWVEGTATLSSSARFSLKGGQKYQFSMYARANTTGKRFYVQLMTTDADVSNTYLVTNQLTYTGAFREYGGEFTAPEGATAAYLRVFANHANGTTTAGHQWFTGFELYEKNGASLIVTGGIVTEHLKITAEMTAALLKAKKVEAIEIDANSLRADTGFIGILRTGILTTDVVTSTHIKSDSITAELLKADAITSKHTLTGPLIRSAASGARTEMTNQGIRVLNSSNVELVRLGYGIGTGMSIRNPVNGVLAPLSNMVFGADYYTSSQVRTFTAATSVSPPGMYSHPPQRMRRTASADQTYTALSESALFFWEATVNLYINSTATVPAEMVPYQLGMNIFNISGGGAEPGEIIDVGNIGRMIQSHALLGNTNGGIGGGDYDAPISGFGLATGLTPGSSYNILIYAKNPSRYTIGATLHTVLLRVSNVRITIIPR